MRQSRGKMRGNGCRRAKVAVARFLEFAASLATQHFPGLPAMMVRFWHKGGCYGSHLEFLPRVTAKQRKEGPFMRLFQAIQASLLLVVPSLGAALAPGSALADEASRTPILVTTPVDKVFEPTGFDDNDDSEVILHGHFNNSCYKIGPATATVDVETATITVEAKSWYYAGGMCAQIVIPFIQTIKLGVLPSGDYHVVVLDRDQAATIPLSIVPAASRSPDDFLYAPVANVDVVSDENGGRQLIVEGTYPYTFVGCMKIIEVRQHVTAGDVIVVQPIAQLFSNNADCVDQSQKNFRFAQPLTGVSDRTEYLAHVRTLGGQSVNRLFDFTN